MGFKWSLKRVIFGNQRERENLLLVAERYSGLSLTNHLLIIVKMRSSSSLTLFNDIRCRITTKFLVTDNDSIIMHFGEFFLLMKKEIVSRNYDANYLMLLVWWRLSRVWQTCLLVPVVCMTQFFLSSSIINYRSSAWCQKYGRLELQMHCSK
jgi:hypothetical protein